jgi:dCTP deaminase
MILNETQILQRLQHPDADKRIVITPLIRPEEQFGPTSVDVRLGTVFHVMRRSQVTHLDLLSAEAEEALKRATQVVTIPPNEAFVLHPGEFALASTLEFFQIPIDLAARLEGRSTWGRLGLQVHATAGFVDPGFTGALTFELSNVSTVPLCLYPGVRIGQLCFFESAPTQLPYMEKRLSKYGGKVATESSAFYRDPEYARLRRIRIMP